MVILRQKTTDRDVGARNYVAGIDGYAAGASDVEEVSAEVVMSEFIILLRPLVSPIASLFGPRIWGKGFPCSRQERESYSSAVIG